jgi:flagellar biosynthesis/type III secretory pathway protein FliH
MEDKTNIEKIIETTKEEWRNSSGITTLEFIAKAQREAYQTGIQDGREEILNELNEEQRKFAEGFAYKPKE